jgi:hypothetical protein
MPPVLAPSKYAGSPKISCKHGNFHLNNKCAVEPPSKRTV